MMTRKKGIKKYVIMSLVTLLIIGGIIFGNRAFKKKVVYVNTLKVELTEHEEMVSCDGRVESLSSKEVFVEYPCIAQDVKVKIGDEVKEGDVLFTIDTEATKAVVATQMGVSPAFISESQLPKEVKSTSSGKISSINVQAGQIVSSETPSAIISSSDKVQIKISIPEGEVKRVKLGQPVKISGVAFSQDSYIGELSMIADVARQNFTGYTTETVVDAVVTISDKDASIKPGLSAAINIVVGDTKKSMIVPYKYVAQDDNNNEYVFVYNGGQAVKRIVVTGRDLDNGFEILSGLVEGDEIITNIDLIEKDKMQVKKVPKAK